MLCALLSLGSCRDQDPLQPPSGLAPLSPDGVAPSSSSIVRTGWIPMPSTSPGSWEMGDVADVSSDGKPDVVWNERSTREMGAWIMDGTTLRGWVPMQSPSSTEWRIGGVADMSSDGKPDVVWQNLVTRETGVWIMDGTTVRSWVPMMSTSSADWRIVGVADMNTDGKADVVWQNRVTREVGVWLMDGTAFRGWTVIGTASSSEWEVGGVADMDVDGKSDIVWQNLVTRETGVWLMNGTTFRGWVVTGSVSSSDWRIGGVADMNGDRQPDIVWHNPATRETGVWIMGGATPPPPPPPPPASSPPPDDALHKVSYTSFWRAPYGMRAAAPWLNVVHTGPADVPSRVEIDHIQLWAVIDGVAQVVEQNTYDDGVYGGELRDRVPWFTGARGDIIATVETVGTPPVRAMVIRPSQARSKVWHPYLEPCEEVFRGGWPCDRKDISQATRVWFETRFRIVGPAAVQAGIDYYALLTTEPRGNRREEGAITDWATTQDQWITLKTEQSTEVANPIVLPPPTTGSGYRAGSTITATLTLRNADDDLVRLKEVGVETLRLAPGDEYCDSSRSSWVPAFSFAQDVDLAPGATFSYPAQWVNMPAGVYCIHVVEQRLGVVDSLKRPIYQKPYSSFPIQKIEVY